MYGFKQACYDFESILHRNYNLRHRSYGVVGKEHRYPLLKITKWLLVQQFARTQSDRRRLGSVTLTGQGLGLGLGTSLFPVGTTEIKGFLPDQ